MDNKRFLILGSGGREHVFAWKLNQSKHNPVIFVAPGNAGTASIAKNVDLSPLDFEAIGNFCLNNNIDVLIPGSEDPLVMGIVDYFNTDKKLNNIFVFGPTASLAQLEGSKDFAKQFLIENNIPTASYRTFNCNEFECATKYIESKSGPYVLKADGLAAGKGVMITDDIDEAKTVLKEMMIDRKFGKACDKLVIEEFLDGIEFSVFAISDGESFKILPMAKDYKRIGDGDSGLNTGGMGAISPVPFINDFVLEKVMNDIVHPTFEGFKKRNESFVGFVFFGLINTKKGPMVIEYNVRMGDPETEVVFPRIQNDFVEILDMIKDKRLNNVNLNIEPGFCTTVFSVSGGYPEAYEKGKKMEIVQPQHGFLFHAGTQKRDDGIYTDGGRVMASTAIAPDLSSALALSYSNLQGVKFDGMYFRNDIGQDLLKF